MQVCSVNLDGTNQQVMRDLSQYENRLIGKATHNDATFKLYTSGVFYETSSLVQICYFINFQVLPFVLTPMKIYNPKGLKNCLVFTCQALH